MEYSKAVNIKTRELPTFLKFIIKCFVSGM